MSEAEAPESSLSELATRAHTGKQASHRLLAVAWTLGLGAAAALAVLVGVSHPALRPGRPLFHWIGVAGGAAMLLAAGHACLKRSGRYEERKARWTHWHIGIGAAAIFLAALVYLLARRLVSPQVRYISLAGDYFPLFLLLGIGLSGVCLRHLIKTDVVAVKELAVGLAAFSPWSADFAAISPLFYGHLFLVCVLLAYLPFSKLSHMAGVFLSPTRNLANSNRAVRHVNPWDYPVKVHPYEEYEDELRDKMKAAGLPVEKE